MIELTLPLISSAALARPTFCRFRLTVYPVRNLGCFLLPIIPLSPNSPLAGLGRTGVVADVIEVAMQFLSPARSLILFFVFSVLLGGCSRGPTDTDPANWWQIGNNDYAQHFSKITDINAQTVSGLKLKWFVDMPTLDGLVGVPLVSDGVVYQSGSLGTIYANDARTGKLLWTFDAEIKFPQGIVQSWGSRLSRGLAIWDDKVIRATGDCRLIAVHRKTGKKVWEAQQCDPAVHTITGAPRVGDGMVFIGTANADTGVGRGHVDAYDAHTGKHLWRFYTVPGDPAKGFENPAMEMASKTWGKEYWKKTGGGNAWEAMTYDPRTGYLIFGTDGSVPLSPLERGEGAGDELFTNAIVAVNAKTGAYVWHYSTTPGDGWNYSATMPIVLADLKIDGKDTPVVMEAPKNGFFYVMDARTGKLVNEPKPFAKVNWATRIDMRTGRPVMTEEAKWWLKGDKGAVVYPYGLGAHNWMPMAFSPETGLVYIPVSEASTRYWSDPRVLIGKVDVDNYHNRTTGGLFKGVLVAWDPVAQKVRWKRDIGAPYQGGTLVTAGNVVFQGTTEGQFHAYRADNGKKLWSFNAGGGILGAPSTVRIDGEQLVLVPTGSGTTSSVGFAPLIGGGVGGPPRLLAFSLKGAAELPVADLAPLPLPRPIEPRPNPKLAAAGKVVWDGAGCELCHGLQAIGGPGSVPDLRRTESARWALFSEMVRGGYFTSSGMPNFSEVVQEREIPALKAYIMEKAWQGYEQQQNKGKLGSTARRVGDEETVYR